MFGLLSVIYNLIKAPYFSNNSIKSLQLKLLQRQIWNCYHNVPYYRQLFKEKGIIPSDIKDFSDLKIIPMITKNEVRKNYQDFINTKYNLKRIYKDHSSGSTGQPFWTYYDKNYWYRKKYLSKLRARLACGMRLNEKIAIFECEPQTNLIKKNDNLLTKSGLLRRKYFSIFDDLNVNVKRIEKFSPQNIYSYPSFLMEIAKILQNREIIFNNVKRIFTSSEYYSSQMRNILQNVFHAEIYDHYGCNEFKEVAWECPAKEGYHINEDELFIEFIENENEVLNGNPGDIVITDLLNRVMPLLRYNTQDKGKMVDHKCSCKRNFKLMSPLAGRHTEYIRLPNGKKLPPYLFTTKIEKIYGVLQFQIVQTQFDKIQIKVVGNHELNSDSIIAMRNSLIELTQNLMDIDIKISPHIPKEKNGKFKIVKILRES